MCGICGIIGKNGSTVDTDDIRKMCNSIYHRGPDDEGIFVYQNIGLGMRRLKIIDLETGNQPIYNEDKSLCIIFNGEIYNYRELKTDLQSIGHKFYTKSDTEVILHLYEEYGSHAPEYLNGMFCFAIWDSHKRQVFIARDRIGIKQLYYSENQNGIIFGSEIKAILCNKSVNRKMNSDAVNDYFSFLYVPSPNTIYSGIKKLPPACYMLIKDSKIQIKKYWKLNYNESGYISGKEAIDGTIQVLTKSIESRMISDVSLGAYLSGGIDSSIIVALMSELTNFPVETFSIKWGENTSSFDETHYARMVSEQYDTNHHEFLVKPDIEEVTDSIVGCFDEPFADSSAIPNYYLAKETKKIVTVALSGLGGDEMAAGYERYLGMKIAKHYNLVPKIFRKEIIKKLVNKIPDSKDGSHINHRLKRFVNTSELPFIERYFNIITTIDENEKRDLFTKDFLNTITTKCEAIRYFERYDQECDLKNNLNRILYLDLNTYLVDDLLTLTDRTSMAHSLEVRVPFLDHNLVEYFAQIDPSLKIMLFSKKYILKKIAERYLPKNLIYRKKMGFSVPLVLWFRGELKNYVKHVLNKKSIEKTNIINYKIIDKILQEHFSGKANFDEKIWSMIIFMLWYNQYIDKIY